MMTRPKNRKPKVLIVGPHPPPPGGMANFIRNLELYDLKNYFEICPFDTDYPRSLKPFRPLTLLWLPIMYIHYIFLLLQVKPALVHIHTPSFRSFYKHCLFAQLAKSKNIPVVLHVHGGKFRDFYDSTNEKEKKNIKKRIQIADRLIVLSEKWYEFFKSIYPEDNIRIVENGIPIDEFYPLDTNEKKTGLNLIFVGEVTPAKGMDELIDACANLSKERKDWKLVVVGAGQIERYRKKADELGISANVKFVGVKKGKELVQIYSKSDIFVFPSHSEGMPLVVLEAMAMKLAVIASSVGSIPEIINEEGGILIPPCDSVSLKNAMSSLIGKIDKINSMGEANRRVVEERFTFSRVSSDVRKIYEELVEF